MTEVAAVPEWAQAPLRDGEYDVPVMFRVTSASQEAARELVARIVAREQFESSIVPMWVPMVPCFACSRVWGQDVSGACTCPDLRCRYCRHPLTDDQERRWGICGTCYDDGTTYAAT